VPALTWSAIAALIRLPNQSGTWLLMLPVLWALVMASRGRPAPSLLLIFAAGSFLMRSAGVIFNDMADRKIDRQITRTSARPLATGAVSVPVAMATACALVAVAAAIALMLNPFTLLLSPVALALAALYPFAKRVIALPQAILGMAFGWGVIMAWAAVRDDLDTPVWFLYAATICWAVGYDTIYSLQDREDDARIGIKSAALLFGEQTWLAVGIALVAMVVLLGAAGWVWGLGVPFYATLAAVAGFFSRQVTRLRRPVSPALAFAMFRHHIWAGAAILLGICLGSF